MSDTKDVNKLRILCLHGFRETGSRFRGRTAALQKRLRDVVEFVYVDAPHKLPVIIQGLNSPAVDNNQYQAVPEIASRMKTAVPAHKNSGTGRRQQQQQQQQWPQEGTGSHQKGGRSRTSRTLRTNQNVSKRAWMLVPEQYAEHAVLDGKVTPACVEDASETIGVSSAAAAFQLDARQFLRQTSGWGETCQYLKGIMLTDGPFDGVLGFSQGAAIAALLCASQWRQESDSESRRNGTAQCCITRHTLGGSNEAMVKNRVSMPNTLDRCNSDNLDQSNLQSSDVKRQGIQSCSHVLSESTNDAAWRMHGSWKPQLDQNSRMEASVSSMQPASGGELRTFRFAILCSGYVSPVREHEKLLYEWRRVGGIPLPSLHIFGSGMNDRQISPDYSKELLACFKPDMASVVQHDLGHLIPATAHVTKQMRTFLSTVSTMQCQGKALCA